MGLDPEPLPGTLAGTAVERGDLEASRHDAGAHLDLHQLHVTDGTALRSARASARASVHGRARIAAVDGDHLELDFHLVTRTSALLGTRLMREQDGTWRGITHACNRDADTTTIEVARGGTPTQEWVTVGDWVAAVDYAVGDTVQLEPVYTLTDRGAHR